MTCKFHLLICCQTIQSKYNMQTTEDLMKPINTGLCLCISKIAFSKQLKSTLKALLNMNWCWRDKFIFGLQTKRNIQIFMDIPLLCFKFRNKATEKKFVTQMLRIILLRKWFIKKWIGESKIFKFEVKYLTKVQITRKFLPSQKGGAQSKLKPKTSEAN